jgi:hypothetical protein
MSDKDNPEPEGVAAPGRREFVGRLLTAGAAGGLVASVASTAQAAPKNDVPPSSAPLPPVKIETEVLVQENVLMDKDKYEEMVIKRLLAKNVLVKDKSGEWRSKVTVLVNSGCVR